MKSPKDRQDRETKARFTQSHYAVVEWWAARHGITVAEFVRKCALERMEQLAALSAASEDQGRAA
jgi:hypothetical protein